MTEQTGVVYLVGAGPGRIDYLTVRGHSLLAQAEVLVYDALVDEELIQIVPASCVQLDVGKRGGKPSVAQAEINQLLVEHCQQGSQVVRLKSGDPFIFGRSTSEIQALNQAGCAFEVVPGISSALAAPLLAGIPLTDPVLSRCFVVMSAHEPEMLDWDVLAQIETLVILMGGKQLPEIVTQLLRQGRSPQTPIAIIRWAGQPQQQIWTGILERIVPQTRQQSLSPSIIVIGEVVGLRPYLLSTLPFSHPLPPSQNLFVATNQSVTDLQTLSNSVSARPLAGISVLVTRAAGQSSQFTALLQDQGATVLEMPAIELGPPSSWEALDQAIAQLHQFDWLILTSVNGVEYFFERLKVQGKDARALAGVKIAVVGKKTATSLQQQGLQPDFIPPDFVADSLVEHFPDRAHLQDMAILFPRVETGGREILVKQLVAQGANVTEVAAYQSGCAIHIPDDVALALQHHAIDIITFASSKTVKCFCQLVRSIQPDLDAQPSISDASPALVLPDSVCVASIGPQTSTTCKDLLGRVDIEAEDYTLEGLTHAIVNWAMGKGT
jgi:uroporphyrinogen III methyltransferase/synthase